MKILILGLFIIIWSAQWSFAQNPADEQEIVDLSKEKWQWMLDKNVHKLGVLFHEKSVFVHMGGSWGKERASISAKVADSGIRRQISIKYK